VRLISWNVNGIRSAQRKGFLEWLERERPDVLCLQETKARPDQLDEALLRGHGYHAAWHSAEKPGYSGVATFAREAPDAVRVGLGVEAFDREGRVLVTRHGDVTLVNAYFPNGQRDCSRVPFKTDFYRAMLAFLEGLRAGGERVVVCGDFNTAHQPIDLKNWRANQKTSGFLPEERVLLDEYVAAGWVDAFRRLHPDATDHYTWWSNRPGVRARNIGWRIDYHFVAPELWPRVRAARLHMDVPGSDHCPVELELSADG
jgi:exodeoxyribonuclease-3